ncbi:hypothetical protein WDW37_11585 [Bdellovibrionota bacterium FG-1]
MKCLNCQKEFPEEAKPRAGIAIMVAGDEYTYSYWQCEVCSFYTVKSYYDPFMGDNSEVTFLPPMSKEVGDRCVALVLACPAPFDKYCECASHQALYRGSA